MSAAEFVTLALYHLPATFAILTPLRYLHTILTPPGYLHHSIIAPEKHAAPGVSEAKSTSLSRGTLSHK